MVPGGVRRIVAAPRGFTITEVVAVAAIIGLLTAVSAPSLWTYIRTARLRAGAEEMVSVLNRARQLAIGMSTTVCVTNDGATAQYRVGTCAGAAWTGVGTDADGSIRLANDLRVSGADHLCFNDLGAGSTTPAPCAANGTLTVTNPSGGATVKVIMATTGRVRIQ
jgi:prepilin-type N-terminal cleavage/methylation domain-containing protein